MSRLTSLLFGSTLRVVATVVVGVVAVGGVALGTGVLGAPSVTGVQNQFGPVTEQNTTIETDLGVANPNPVGVQLGGTTVDYTVYMNDVRMAGGQKEGLQVRTANSTVNFTTRMDNGQIPPWWYSHIDNGERTQVRIDARVTSALTAGQTVSLAQDQTIETDLIGQFNSETDRPVNANRPGASDPVLWINETSADWDQERLSPERTPMNMSFEVYNPNPYPYAVTELGYTVTMNNITVGEGSSEDVATIPPGATRTIDTWTVIDNENLDEWWVSHLQRNQTTDLEIQFYAVIDPVEEGGLLGSDPVGEFRVPLDGVDYRRTIETDIFRTNAEAGASGNGSADGTQGTPTEGDESGTPTATSTPAETDTPTPTPTTTDDGILDDGTRTATPTPTATDDGTTTTDGGLLG